MVQLVMVRLAFADSLAVKKIILMWSVLVSSIGTILNILTISFPKVWEDFSP